MSVEQQPSAHSMSLAVRQEHHLEAASDAKVQRIAAVRAQLKDSTAAEAKDVRDKAEAFETYARARALTEEYAVAGEAKLWAERRLGELRAAWRGDGKYVTHFDDELGLDRWHGAQYERLAGISEERFTEILVEIRATDGAYNANGVLGRASKGYETRIEPGIYRLEDGRHVLQYKLRGVKRREVLNLGHDIERARETLARRKGLNLPAEGNPRSNNLNSIGNEIHLAIIGIDRLDRRGANHEAKQALDEAQAALYKAQDAIIRARLRWGL